MGCSNRRIADTHHEAYCQHLTELNAHGKILLAFAIEHKLFPNAASAKSLFLPSLNGKIEQAIEIMIYCEKSEVVNPL